MLKNFYYYIIFIIFIVQVLSIWNCQHKNYKYIKPKRMKYAPFGMSEEAQGK